jgi:hypothetical protein
MAATVETPRASGPFRLGRPVTLTLIEYPINDEDRQMLINYGAAAVAARKRQIADGEEVAQTDEGAALKALADELRKRIGVQWTRPAFLPRMEFSGDS